MWYFMREDFRHGISFMFYAASVGISLILDIPWFVIVSGKYWDTCYIDDCKMSDIRHAAVIAAFINWIIKIFAIVFSIVTMNKEPTSLKAGPGY